MNMKTAASVLTLTSLALTPSGCATVFRGEHRKLSVNSEPESAQVYINGTYHGRTPLRIELRPNQPYTTEAPRTYVRGICPLQALERLSPKRGFATEAPGAPAPERGSLHGLASVDSREGIEFRKEGFKTEVRQIKNEIGIGWVVLDVVCGLVPVLVDALTGSWYDLDQRYVNAILERRQIERPGA